MNKRRKKDKMEQLHLVCVCIAIFLYLLVCVSSAFLIYIQDYGQKLFGHVTCKVCGMVYTHGQLDDQTEHSRFHKKFVTGINFPVS